MSDEQSTTITAEGLGFAIGAEWSFRDWLDFDAAVLTTDHARSSRGLPVLLRDGRAYGPADLPGVTLVMSATNESDAALISAARAAGWTLRICAWCEWCGEAMAQPETRKPGDMHERCAPVAADIKAKVAADRAAGITYGLGYTDGEC